MLHCAYAAGVCEDEQCPHLWQCSVSWQCKLLAAKLSVTCFLPCRLLLAQPSVPPGRKPKGYVSPAAAFAPTSSTRFNFFPSNYASFAALEDIPRLDLPRDMYLRPSWGSLPGLDSFRLAGDLFQLTRSSVKAPMTDALLRVLAVLPEEAVPRLYIVVPNRTIFDDWVAPIPLRTLEVRQFPEAAWFKLAMSCTLSMRHTAALGIVVR